MDRSAVVRFGPFTFDRDRMVLERDGRPVPIDGRGTALPSALVDAGGEVVTRSELLDAAWPGRVVEERNLKVQVAGLRNAMGELPDGEDPIRTVSRVGYRLMLDAPAAPAPRAPSVRPSVAVLPFANLSPDPDLPFFADGVTEDLITAVSRLESFAVVARSASFAFKGRSVDLSEIAPNARGPLHRRGQRAPVRQPRPRERPADRCDRRDPALGRDVREGAGRHLRHAGPHNGERRGSGRAVHHPGRDRAGAPQAPREPRRLRPLPFGICRSCQTTRTRDCVFFISTGWWNSTQPSRRRWPWQLGTTRSGGHLARTPRLHRPG